jgi:hypothetical protein
MEDLLLYLDLDHLSSFSATLILIALGIWGTKVFTPLINQPLIFKLGVENNTHLNLLLKRHLNQRSKFASSQLKALIPRFQNDEYESLNISTLLLLKN